FLRTACFLAVEQDLLASVKMLIDARRLLHRAAYCNSTSLIEFLLSRGAKVDAEDKRRQIALMANADMKHIAGKLTSISMILAGADIDYTYDRGVHEIYRAAVHRKISMVEFFLSNGIDASIFGDNGWTPLHAAAANGHRECVQLLLNNDAKLSAISDTGKTPLDLVEARETLYD
ncbi:ankyrin repeat-containing domain protein, partial [Diaporthe sp. PMI_573]